MPDIKQDDLQEPIYEPKDSEAYKIIGIVFIILFIMVSAILLAIVVFNSNNDRIISGIYIKNVNVSGLTKQEAITKVNKNLEEYMDDSLVLVHNEYRTEISLEQLEATFDRVVAYGIVAWRCMEFRGMGTLLRHTSYS